MNFPVSVEAARWLAIPLGILFGVLLHRGGVANYNVIVNQFRFKDFTVLKVMFTAIIVGGIGRVHDPLLLPLVHNTILRMPLVVWPTAPWFPWHAGGAKLARGLVAMDASIARGGLGLGPLVRMLPDVILSAITIPE